MPEASPNAPALQPRPDPDFSAMVDLSPLHNGAGTAAPTGAKSGGLRVRLDLNAPLREALAEAPLRMDHKKHRQMTRGKLSPEARLDLHGMTLNAAQPALIRFLLEAHSNGARLALVITGKGRAGGPDAPLPVRPGALRYNVPHWLHMPPLSAIVLQVTAAHQRHGGDGAYYVYLRR